MADKVDLNGGIGYFVIEIKILDFKIFFKSLLPTDINQILDNLTESEKEIDESISIVKLQNLMEKQLKKRTIKYPDKYQYLVPSQLKYLVYFLNPSKKQYRELEDFLYSMYDEEDQKKLNIS